MEKTWRATVVRGDRKDTAGIVVPAEVLDTLGGGRRPPVVVTFLGYTYRTTVGGMGGQSLIPVSGEHRAASGLGEADTLEVTVRLDQEPRTVAIPDDLAQALTAAGVQAAFDASAPSHRKEWVRQVEEAKAAATREKRVAKVIEALRGS